MSYILRPQRWRRKPPPGATAIDWNHPLARGLAFCALFNERGASFALDYVRMQAATPNGSVGWLRDGSKIASATADYWSWPGASIPEAPFLGDITLIWRGTIDTGSNYRHFAGKHASNGSTNNPFDFRTDNLATPTLQLVRADAASNSAQGGGPAVTLGVEKQYAASNAAGVAGHNYYVDRTKTTGSALAITPTGSGASLQVGRRADGVVQMDGSAQYLYIHSRVLSDGEIAALWEGPYQFLRPQQRRVYVDLGAGGDTLMPQACF